MIVKFLALKQGEPYDQKETRAKERIPSRFLGEQKTESDDAAGVGESLRPLRALLPSQG